MKKPLLLIMAIVLCGSPLSAATPMPADDLVARMNALEAETLALRAELRQLRATPVRLPVIPVSMATLAGGEGEDVDSTAYSWTEIKSQIKDNAWSIGDYKVVPYGILWTNMVYSNQRTYPGSYTLWVPSPVDGGQSQFEIDARSTRLGMDIAGPRIRGLACAKSGGKVEIDFQSSLTSSSNQNKASVMLRHAYWEVKNDDFRLLAGQTWDVISPLTPGTLMYSVGWGAGNIGYRRAQFRFERYLALSNTSLVTLEGSLNQNIFGDHDTALGIKGYASGWPILEGRIAYTLGQRTGRCARPIICGVSGHIGDQEFDGLGLVGAKRRTWSFNVDLRVPITERFGFRGEYFRGQDLGTFLGGIIQGINRTTGVPIRSHGGWFELYCDWTPTWHSRVGYSLDDPENADLTASGRTYNSFIYANLSHNVTKKFLVGVEVSTWKTLYQNDGALAPGEAVRTEFVAKYGF